MASGDHGTKYARIADDLRKEIVEGQLAEGAEVPGENALMKRYGVARMTARRALSVLREQGLVDVRRGKGTFVRARHEPRAMLKGSVEVPRELLEELRKRHGLAEGDIGRVLPKVELKLVEAGDAGTWAVEYRVPLD
ncbi:GntR family transcriptional regulator [Streptomyces sp. NPDC052687]|uniref:GntR family transcriptional regulator n=1 Tax=Streptomyces sp. NPDC052687 TaxID=3154759 RepID=UPI003430EF9B